MKAFDFFCGGGGLTRGLLDAGIRVVAGFDICQDFKDTYERNNNVPFICKDIRDVDETFLFNICPELKTDIRDFLFAGCAPCQPFSQQRKGNTVHKDIFLLTEFGRLVKLIKPGYLLIENVPGIKDKGKEVFDEFLKTLEQLGYNYCWKVLNAKNYGVPQNRRRLVLLASLFCQPEMPPETHGKGRLPYVTVSDTIKKYPPINAGEECADVPNHKAAGISDMNLERLKYTPIDGGTRTQWPERLVLKCHKSKEYTGHTDVYGRMRWNGVAPTLTARCYSISNGRYGHPEQNRAISLREAAALQSFRDDYIFYGSSMASIGRQIGNAVPVKLAYALGCQILKMQESTLCTK